MFYSISRKKHCPFVNCVFVQHEKKHVYEQGVKNVLPFQPCSKMGQYFHFGVETKNKQIRV